MTAPATSGPAPAQAAPASQTPSPGAPPATDRRSFLKSGALVAAPVAAVAAPAAAFADDGSRARLARLEDERAIEALHKSFLRRINGSGDCAEFLARADAVELDPRLTAIAEEVSDEAGIELSANGLSAHARHACRVELDSAFTGDTTLERMARFQGQGSHRHSEARLLVTDYVKGKDGWRIARARLA